jgi:hypothetical protein
MKKTPGLFLLLFFSLLGTAPGEDNPFAGARWQGRLVYRDPSGVQRSDLYELILVPNGTCIVTLSSRQGRGPNAPELFQDGDGLWSYDKNFFRLDCDFFDPVLEHLPGLSWTSVYQFDNQAKTRFTLLIKPYPAAEGLIRAAFVRTDD